MQTVLASSSKSTVITTQIVIGGGRWNRQDDGSVRLFVHPVTLRLDSDGNEIGRETSADPVEVVLSPAQFSGISALIKEAYDAKQAAAEAAAKGA